MNNGLVIIPTYNEIENVENLKGIKSPNLPIYNNELYKVYKIESTKFELKNSLPNYGNEIWRTAEGNNNRTRLFLMTNIMAVPNFYSTSVVLTMLLILIQV